MMGIFGGILVGYAVAIGTILFFRSDATQKSITPKVWESNRGFNTELANELRKYFLETRLPKFMLNLEEYSDPVAWKELLQEARKFERCFAQLHEASLLFPSVVKDLEKQFEDRFSAEAVERELLKIERATRIREVSWHTGDPDE